MILNEDRRGFLLAAAAALAHGCVRASSTAQPQAPALHERKPSVIVIGAGLAGLTIAYKLYARGYDVRVLEATERPGGRILTVRKGFRDGLFVEAGATHVVGDPDLLALLTELDVALEDRPRTKGLARVRFVAGKRSVLRQGEPPPAADPEPQLLMSPADEALGEEGRMDKYFAISRSFDPTLPLPPSLYALDAQTAGDFLRQQGASPAFVADIDGMLALGDKGIEGLSALSLLQLWAEILREIGLGPGPGGKVAGGTDNVPRALAAKLGERVLYRAPVLHVEQSARDVRVVFEQQGKRAELRADRAVIAIPPPVAHRLSFSPLLPADKQRALAEIELESVSRLWLETSQRFWIERGESGRVDTDQPLGAVRDESDGLPGTAGILGLYTTREAARRLGSLSEDERAKAVLAYVEQAQPGTAQHSVAFASKCWDSDPYQRGAYAYFKPGQLTTLFGPLARKEGRLHFAGDHTSHRPGFMHGAVASALRVVREIAG